jgi:hypothetical protein
MDSSVLSVGSCLMTATCYPLQQIPAKEITMGLDVILIGGIIAFFFWQTKIH